MRDERLEDPQLLIERLSRGKPEFNWQGLIAAIVLSLLGLGFGLLISQGTPDDESSIPTMYR